MITSLPVAIRISILNETHALSARRLLMFQLKCIIIKMQLVLHFLSQSVLVVVVGCRLLSIDRMAFCLKKLLLFFSFFSFFRSFLFFFVLSFGWQLMILNNSFIYCMFVVFIASHCPSTHTHTCNNDGTCSQHRIS